MITINAGIYLILFFFVYIKYIAVPKKYHVNSYTAKA